MPKVSTAAMDADFARDIEAGTVKRKARGVYERV